MVKTNNELLTPKAYETIQWQESVGCAAFESGKARQVQGDMNAEPIPRGNHRFELSWAMQSSLMRLRHPVSGLEWFFREAIGHIHVTGCNDVTHRMNWYGQAKLAGDLLYVFRPTGMRVPFIPSGMGTTYMPKSQYRLCANIGGDNWRLRDEPTGRLLMVDGFYGSLHLNYLDKGSHVFHIDDCVLDRNIETGLTIAHFIDNDLDWEYAPLEAAHGN